MDKAVTAAISINRIRLEFKGHRCSGYRCCSHRINRIRLEFKGRTGTDGNKSICVLIESDWNLKPFTLSIVNCCSSINRIRLEFKDLFLTVRNRWQKRINRIRLEFKVLQRSRQEPEAIQY